MESATSVSCDGDGGADGAGADASSGSPVRGAVCPAAAPAADAEGAAVDGSGQGAHASPESPASALARLFEVPTLGENEHPADGGCAPGSIIDGGSSSGVATASDAAQLREARRVYAMMQAIVDNAQRGRQPVFQRTASEQPPRPRARPPPPKQRYGAAGRAEPLRRAAPAAQSTPALPPMRPYGAAELSKPAQRARDRSSAYTGSARSDGAQERARHARARSVAVGSARPAPGPGSWAFPPDAGRPVQPGAAVGKRAVGLAGPRLSREPGLLAALAAEAAALEGEAAARLKRLDEERKRAQQAAHQRQQQEAAAAAAAAAAAEARRQAQRQQVAGLGSAGGRQAARAGSFGSGK